MNLEVLPLTPNGKLDRRALPAPELASTQTHYRAPRTAHEVLLCQLYAELTGVQTVGLDDSFFAIGGHSLLAMRLIARIRQETNLSLPLRALFENPTPEALALQLSNLLFELDSKVPSNLLLLRAGKSDLPPLFCIHAASGISTVYRDLSLALSGEFPVWGIQAHGFEVGEQPHATIKEMAVSYAQSIRDIIGKNPCRLLGWSVGGLVAHAVAYELEELGGTVEDLILLDARTQLVEGLALRGDESDGDIVFEHILSEALELEGDEVTTLLGGSKNKLAALQRLMIDQGVVAKDAPLELINKISHQMILYPQRLSSYKIGVICAPITLIRAALEDAPISEMVFDWTNNTSGGVRELSVMAKHNQMVMPEQSAEIAKILKGLI